MVKIGMAGTGGIVRLACEKIQRIEGAEVTAAWAHSKEHGKMFADDYHVQVYTDYEEFVHSQIFDTIYIGLPNQVHYQFMLEAIQAGKNVICEKPFVPDLAECRELIQMAEKNHVFLFDATANRYYENLYELKRRLPEIGNTKMVVMNMSQQSSKYAAYKQRKIYPVFDPACYGGALYDLNCINVNLLITLFGKPLNETYFPNRGFNGIDTSGLLLLEYDGFKTASITAKDSNAEDYLSIQATDGEIIMHENPGVLENIYLKKTGREPEKIDIEDVSDQRENMFRKIFVLIENKDYQTMKDYLAITQTVMEVLFHAAKKAKMKFPEEK